MRRPGGLALAGLLVASCASGHGDLIPSSQAPAPAAEVPQDEHGSVVVPPLDAASPLPETALPPSPAPDEADPYEVLWGHRLDFAPGGEPLVTIRLFEGQSTITFRTRGPAVLRPRGGEVVHIPQGARFEVQLSEAHPGRLAYYALVAHGPKADRPRLEEIRREYAARGVTLKSRQVGDVHGVAGRVVDNRRELLLVDTDGTEEAARAQVEGLRDRFGTRAELYVEVAERSKGTVTVVGENDRPLAEADSVVVAEASEGFVLEDPLSGKAGGTHESTYLGRIYFTVDAHGLLAAVHGVPLEELLLGIVPSEMPASSPLEALKAQAVTARSNVLAQLGTRHLTDPFMLCSDVHCQAYRGDGARTARTDQAVYDTRGEALFGKRDHAVVDAVYSATCGGHGEDNDKVWGNAPNASLRGHPDMPEGESARWDRVLSDEGKLRLFLRAGRADSSYCRRPTGKHDLFRWERRLTSGEMDSAVAALEVGHVRSLRVTARGVSGRARVLVVVGDRRTSEVNGELKIRRILKDLPSAMFVLDREGEIWVVKGGGWGHGAGMCQWGAVGRAEAGQDYRQILRAYFSGAEVSALY